VAQSLHAGGHATPPTAFTDEKPFARVTHKQAVNMLLNDPAATPFRVTPTPTNGFHKEHEWALLRLFDNRPVFVTHAPAADKPFYMRVNADNEAECFDLLVNKWRWEL
jgi:asparaginyl-tRNA synthetase